MSNKKPKVQTSKPKAKEEELVQQVAELTEALQRERADALNVRRRADEERAAMSTFYKAMVVRELLPVIDNLERALKHSPISKDLNEEGDKTVEWIRGITKIKEQLDKVFIDLGIERIKTVGEAFDPRYHEAVSMDGGDGTHEVVSEELQAGYKLGDEVLRHAMVKVKMQGHTKSEGEPREQTE